MKDFSTMKHVRFQLAEEEETFPSMVTLFYRSRDYLNTEFWEELVAFEGWEMRCPPLTMRTRSGGSATSSRRSARFPSADRSQSSPVRRGASSVFVAEQTS